MSAFIDFEDKSVDKAIEKACKELNIARDRLRYDIISHGSSGIFGLVGAKKAHIRVSTPRSNDVSKEPDTEPVKAESDSSDTLPAAAITPEPFVIEVSTEISALVDEAFGEDKDNNAVIIEKEDEDPLQPEAAELSEQNYEAAADWIQKFLEQTIELISPDAKITAQNQAKVLYFKIQGGDAARIIGKRGQTLDSIQYLVEKAVNKQFGPGIPVEIDVEDYLERRRSELIELATRLADKAIQTGKPMVINRINSQDRRVVHLALKENREIRTQSAGNGDLRKLLILPRKKSSAKKNGKNG